MKKRRAACRRILPVLIAALLLLPGCAVHGRQIRSTSEGFLQALADRDQEAAGTYAAPEVLEKEELRFLDEKRFEEALYAQLESSEAAIQRKDLTEEAQAAISEFARTLAEQAFLDYEILEIREKDKVGTVRAKVTLGYTPEHEVLFDSSGNASQEIEAYEQEHKEELLELYTAQGEKAMNRKIYSDVIVIMAHSMQEAVANAEPVPREIILTVEKVDDRWIVTEAGDGNSN